ncbi:AEC family transporter [Rhodobacteraceae bacterium 2CG4]|uniref:AEC family transporter n=1 Tax=Halovulum marinum TaxID=2662447 RepID=A0A6L5YZ28_9RHOB|nr:AEC family transporter [Halovulum marinum]MSU89468.1 AEC family transporter [Halovulum marinum]
MALILEVLQIVAPVFLLAGIGWGWVRMGLFYDVEFVTRLAMSLAMPCLIFTALMRTEIDPARLRDAALATVAAYGAVAVAAAALLRAARLSQRTFFAPMTFGNTGNLGLPLALFAFGGAGLDYAVVIFAIMTVIYFSIGLWVVSGNANPARVLREPMLWASLLGGLFLVQGWTLPDWSVNALELVGQIAIPMMLITLGVAISRLRPGGVGRALWLSAVKLVLCVAVGLGTARWFGLEPLATGVLVLQVSTPVAVTSFMLAEKYGADSDEVAGMVVVSTLIAVLAIPALLAVFI